MKLHIENVGEYLKSHDIKPSYQRIKIFEYLVEHKNHPTVDIPPLEVISIRSLYISKTAAFSLFPFTLLFPKNLYLYFSGFSSLSNISLLIFFVHSNFVFKIPLEILCQMSGTQGEFGFWKRICN
jgi:hypothetical protein